METEKLKLGRLIRKGEAFRDGPYVHDREYIDFIISGQSLTRLFDLQNCELLGVLGWRNKMEDEIKRIRQFTGVEKPALQSGRTCLFVCRECGDIGCGAITVQILFTDETVVWKDFGWETDYSEPRLDEYKTIGPFTFKKYQYLKQFEELLDLTKNSKKLPISQIIVAVRY